MKNYCNNPTDENIIEMFRADAIGRKDYIVRFIRLINAIDDCCSIAIDGEWGSGKTFFTKQTKVIMDCSNPNSNMNDETREKIKLALSNLNYVPFLQTAHCI